MQEINFKCDVQLQLRKLIRNLSEEMKFRNVSSRFPSDANVRTYVSESTNSLCIYQNLFSRKGFSKYTLFISMHLSKKFSLYI